MSLYRIINIFIFSFIIIINGNHAFAQKFSEMSGLSFQLELGICNPNNMIISQSFVEIYGDWPDIGRAVSIGGAYYHPINKVSRISVGALFSFVRVSFDESSFIHPTLGFLDNRPLQTSQIRSTLRTKYSYYQRINRNNAWAVSAYIDLMVPIARWETDEVIGSFESTSTRLFFENFLGLGIGISPEYLFKNISFSPYYQYNITAGSNFEGISGWAGGVRVDYFF